MLIAITFNLALNSDTMCTVYPYFVLVFTWKHGSYLLINNSNPGYKYKLKEICFILPFVKVKHFASGLAYCFLLGLSLALLKSLADPLGCNLFHGSKSQCVDSHTDSLSGSRGSTF